jgi:hypothetical protein
MGGALTGAPQSGAGAGLDDAGDRRMSYDDFFAEALSRLWEERRYRIFAESNE